MHTLLEIVGKIKQGTIQYIWNKACLIALGSRAVDGKIECFLDSRNLNLT